MENYMFKRQHAERVSQCFIAVKGYMTNSSQEKHLIWEMAQWLGMHTVLPQGLSLVPSAHNKCSQLPITLAPGKYTTSHE